MIVVCGQVMRMIQASFRVIRGWENGRNHAKTLRAEETKPYLDGQP